MRVDEGYVIAGGGLRLFYQKLGSGPATVVPNGMYLMPEFKQLAASRTMIFYDVRNRGRSDCADSGRGIHDDVEDLEAVRRWFGAGRMNLMAHSYMGLVVALYAMKYPQHANRVVQICPIQPDARVQYPAHLMCADETLRDVLSKLALLREEPLSGDPIERCTRFWSVLREIYTADPADAGKIHWSRCELENERNFLAYWNRSILPSIQSLKLPPDAIARAEAPFLIIHGVKDRSSPYGGGRDWAMTLPNARLITLDHVAHAPWIESPQSFFTAVETFLTGAWPDGAEKVMSLDPGVDKPSHPGADY